jgi:transcriptional regulator with XRE-family HTH domain
MSAFSEQLRITLDAADLSQVELSELTKISQSTISRYLKGEIKPEAEVFGQLLDAVPDSLHFELIVARLSDELPKKYRDAVTILAHGGGVVREQAGTYMPAGLAKDLRRALEHLAQEAVQQPAVRDLVVSLAKALGAEQGDAPLGSVLDMTLNAEAGRRDQAKRDRKSS